MLEGFVDWVNHPTRETQGDSPAPQIANGSAVEGEQDMSSLAVGFAAQMRKRAASAQGETTLGSEVPSGKRLK